MCQHQVPQKARTWIFKAHAVARPASAFFEPAFFPQILDGCKPRQMRTISKADTICYLATKTDPEHAYVEEFILAGCQVKQGSLEQWLHHPAIQAPVEWTPVTANSVQIYTAHP